MVDPVDPLQGGVLDLVEALPGAAAADQLGLVQADDGLGQALSKLSPREPTEVTAPASARRSV